MDFIDSEIIPISAISHHLYCPRQCALIHVEGIFNDNALTIGGNIGHEKVDQEKSFDEHGIKKETSMSVYSDRLGIVGIADVVEFPENAPPLPIDYKHGKIKNWVSLEAQVCAIALCLDEMLGVAIQEGAIYHIQSHKRRKFEITEKLKNITLNAISEIRFNLVNSITPPPVFDKKCDNCSLKSACMPQFISTPQDTDIFKVVKLNE